MRGWMLCAFLLVGAAGRAAEEAPWVDSLEEARALARTQRKPVLCLLDGRDRSSRVLIEAFDRRRLAALRRAFVCVKLDFADSGDLVRKHDLRAAPATIVYASIGTPMKLIVGPMPVARYAAHLEEALEKHAELFRPRRPSRPPPAKEGAEHVPRRMHGAACPGACITCTPALKRALAWLRARQDRDGRWSKPAAERVTRAGASEIDRSIDHVDVALTAFAGLALLASGGEDERCAKAASFLVACVRPDGVCATVRGNDYLHLVYANFQTPLAMMFLAEMQARAPDEARGRALTAMAEYLVRVQDGGNGAWGYGPDFREHPPQARRGWRLFATTQLCLTGLLHARDAGVAVPERTIARAAAYLVACRGRDGGFVYRAEDRATAGVPGTTAAALYTLLRAGAVDDAAMEGTWARYRRDHADIGAFGRHWWIYCLWTALAMHRRGPGAFAEFDRGFRDRVLHRQRGDGSWTDPDDAGGSVLATAIAVTVLQLDRGALRLATARPDPPVVEVVPEPAYLAVDPGSRVKVFRHGDGYRYDLIIAVEEAMDDALANELAACARAANRIVFDATDGQFAMHAVTICDRRRRWGEADIRIGREFYDTEKNTHPWAHGMTRVGRRTYVVGGRERRGRRIGMWILFPPRGMPWAHPRAPVVLAHELGHYLFGCDDEYLPGGEMCCDCLMGLRGATELCREAGHTDDRFDEPCWALAKRLYPALSVPEDIDPGPWNAADPVIRIER